MSLFKLFIFGLCWNGIAAITAGDKSVLEKLFSSTDGPNWTTTWDLAVDLCGQHGVECDGGGSVTRLDLGRNQLSGSIPPEIGNMNSLIYLDLRRSKLCCSIPSEIGNMNSLTQLYLYGNQLSGSIPPEIGNMNSLTTLLLHNNQLYGSIPPGIGSMNSLNNLYLSSNQLSGSIPEIGNMTSLEVLYLNSNQLSGSIPEIGNMNSLRVLDLRNNQLSGSIPPEIGNMNSLDHLYLANNDFFCPYYDYRSTNDYGTDDYDTLAAQPCPELCVCSGASVKRIYDFDVQSLIKDAPPTASRLHEGAVVGSVSIGILIVGAIALRRRRRYTKIDSISAHTCTCAQAA